MKYTIPYVILSNSARLFFFKQHKHTYRYKGYLSNTARQELQNAGNEVIRDGDRWIIRPKEVL